MPAPLVPALGRSQFDELRAIAHLELPAGWFAANLHLFGEAPTAKRGILLRRTAGGRQLTRIELIYHGAEAGRERLHLEFTTIRSTATMPANTKFDREYDRAAPVVAGATSPDTEWSVGMDRPLGSNHVSAVALPAPLAVDGKQLQIRGLRIAGTDEAGAYMIILDQPDDDLTHMISFSTRGELSSALVERWLSRARSLSDTFLIGTGRSS